MPGSAIAILALSPFAGLAVGAVIGFAAGWLIGLSLPWSMKRLLTFGIVISFAITRFTGPYGGGPITGLHAFFFGVAVAILLQAGRPEDE